MKNLENYGVQELGTNELANIGGGNPILRWVGATLGSFIYDVIADWESNTVAFNEGFEETCGCE